MIRLFGQTDRSFTSNGDRVIHALRARVKSVDNGDFYLDLATDLSYVNDLTEGRIIIAPTPQGDQPFRVSNVQLTKSKITAQCPHVFFDSKNYLIEDSYVVDKNCNAALDHLNTATEPQSEFTTISDVPTVDSYRCVRKSLYEAVNEVRERWGGHIVLNNFQIGIRASIGQDNGVVVRYAKNLKDISVEEDWNDVVTKLMPIGYDGLKLPEVYLTSTTQYTLPYTKTVSFDQSNIDQEDYIDSQGNLDEEAYHAALEADLREKAEEYLAQNCVPKVNYTLSANLEKVTGLGDTVDVIDERLGISVRTTVVSYEYDCILEGYRQLEFGNYSKTLRDYTGTIMNQTENIVKQSTDSIQADMTSGFAEANDKIDVVQNNLENGLAEVDTKIGNEVNAMQVTLTNELNEAANRIWGVLGDSYVIYEGDKILVVDSLPKETAQNVIMINNGGIAFSQTGINGTFVSAWTIDGTFNAQNINVINFTADLIKGGTLRLGSALNQSGILELYDASNTLIGKMDRNGLKMYGQDGSYVLLNNEVGLAGYDRNNNKIYWVSEDEFHMKKSVVEQEITLCNKIRWIPITLTDGNNNITSDGTGIVSVATS